MKNKRKNWKERRSIDIFHIGIPTKRQRNSIFC